MHQTERLLELLDEEGPRLHRLLYRLTMRADIAEDLLQELFLKLCRTSGFLAASSPVAFAIRTAVNLAFDWRRRQTRRVEAAALDVAAEGGVIAGPPIDFLGGLIQREQMEQVLAAMVTLPEAQRVALILQYVEHQETDEIGRQLGRTPHQVRALCAKGLASLRAKLNDQSRKEVTDG